MTHFKTKEKSVFAQNVTTCSLFNLISIFFRVKSRYWLGVRICLTLWESENWVIQRLLWPGWPELLTSPDSSWSFSWQLQLAWGAGRPSNTNENELVRGKNILKCVQMGPECARHESYSYQAHPAWPGTIENCNINSTKGGQESIMDRLDFLALPLQRILFLNDPLWSFLFSVKNVLELQQNLHSNISEEDG